MQQLSQVITSLRKGAYGATLARLYPSAQLAAQLIRYQSAVESFAMCFGAQRDICFFSAPGRTEVGGNHTDHQDGRVLAAAVNLDILCVAARNKNEHIRIKSEGYPQDDVDLSELSPRRSEENTAAALIRGIAARCVELGYRVGGFDAYTVSDVLKGSGLSSSAAFEVAVGTIISHLFNGGRISPVEIAQIGQCAENTYFGKPSGLMDQMASSVGGFVAIDFADAAKPLIEPVAFDFAAQNHTLCIVDTKGNHADLTPEYAAIPREMKAVSELFGVQKLRQVDERSFFDRLPEVRQHCGDRAALRAIHFFSENARVPMQATALQSGDFGEFKRLVVESGQSSFCCLQNVFACAEPKEQGLSLALALSKRLLRGRGAWRVHGGGFAGTIQAFVPDGLLGLYCRQMAEVFGEGSCHMLSVRQVGGAMITPGE